MLFPSENDKRAVLVILSFCLGLALGVSVKVADGNIKEYLPSLVTLVAAFAGAWAAYLLQRRKEDIQKTEEKVDSGNKAIFSLIRSHNSFIDLKKQAIDPKRDHPYRFVAIQPIIGEGLCGLDINYDSLSFLFKSKNPNILNEISSLQSDIESTMSLLKERSDLHRDQVQPAAERGGFRNDEHNTKDEIETALGYRLCETMRSLTDQLVESIDIIVSETEDTIEELHELLKEKFKGHVIVGMKKPNK